MHNVGGIKTSGWSMGGRIDIFRKEFAVSSKEFQVFTKPKRQAVQNWTLQRIDSLRSAWFERNRLGHPVFYEDLKHVYRLSYPQCEHHVPKLHSSVGLGLKYDRDFLRGNIKF